jgi:hypothetical protein
MPPLGAFCYPAGLFEFSPLHYTPAAGSRWRHNSPGQRKKLPRERTPLAGSQLSRLVLSVAAISWAAMLTLPGLASPVMQNSAG